MRRSSERFYHFGIVLNVSHDLFFLAVSRTGTKRDDGGERSERKVVQVKPRVDEKTERELREDARESRRRNDEKDRRTGRDLKPELVQYIYSFPCITICLIRSCNEGAFSRSLRRILASLYTTFNEAGDEIIYFLKSSCDLKSGAMVC